MSRPVGVGANTAGARPTDRGGWLSRISDHGPSVAPWPSRPPSLRTVREVGARAGEEEDNRMVNLDSRRVVVVTRPALPGAGLDRLAEHVEVVRYAGGAAPTLDPLVPLLGRADGLLSMTTDRVDALLLDAAPRLRVVSNAGVGTDNLDLPAVSYTHLRAHETVLD